MLRSCVLRQPRVLMLHAAAAFSLTALLVLLLPLAMASPPAHQEQLQRDHRKGGKGSSTAADGGKSSAGLEDEAVPAVLRAGPYATALTEGQLTIRDDVTPACAGSGCTLKLHLTSPVRTPTLQPGSVPIVLMFSGFQLPASYYAVYAHALASWGFAALRYDLPGAVLQKVIRDDEEIKFVPVLIQWLAEQDHDPAAAVYELLNLRSVAGFGHSRGAKLAALSLVGGLGGMSTAVLMDPVDMTSMTRKRGYPSAVQALTEHPHKALLIGAGITGWCNPADEGWGAFWPVLQPGSWLQRVVPAGHCQFLDVKGVSAWSLDRLCGAGNVTHKAVIHWAQGGAVAWLLDAFRHEQSEDLVQEWLAWVVGQQGSIEWSIKQAPQVRQAAAERAGGVATSERQHVGVAGAAGGVGGQPSSSSS